MNLIISTINREIDELKKNGIKIKVIGDISNLPNKVKKKLTEAEKFTNHNNKLILNLAINYGSKQEIVNAVKLISDGSCSICPKSGLIVKSIE